MLDLVSAVLKLRSPVHTDPRLDPPEDPLSAGRRPLDLATRRRTHPAPPRPTPDPRPAPTLGETSITRAAHTRPGPTRVPEHPRDHAPTRQRTETHQTRTRTPTPGARNRRTRTPPRRREDHQAGPDRQDQAEDSPVALPSNQPACQYGHRGVPTGAV